MPASGDDLQHTFSRAFGLEEVVCNAAPRHHDYAQEVVDAQQVVLSNIMIVSAVLLGFIVTGTLLSMQLTGSENYGSTEVLQCLRWAALAAIFAFLSLIVAFLLSISGSNHLTTSGPKSAAETLTTGSVLRHIVAEAGLYMSLFCFIVSLGLYVSMAYSGPDICATYRGSASFCAHRGEDLYRAAELKCKHRCLLPGQPPECRAEDDMTTCLCAEFCRHPWERGYDWSRTRIRRSPGVGIFNYHFFAYRSYGDTVKPTREKVIDAAASVMCNHEELERKKDSCVAAAGIGARGCNPSYMAWEESERCLEAAIRDAHKCTKVCSWSDSTPPRGALKRAIDDAFVPLGVMLLLVTLGRVIVIIAKAYRALHSHHAVLKRFIGLPQESDDEESAE